jgi:hypothetical protein
MDDDSHPIVVPHGSRIIPVVQVEGILTNVLNSDSEIHADLPW